MNIKSKIAMASLLFTVVISMNTATVATPRKKSRDIALIKAIGGSLFTIGGGLYGAFVGPITILMGIHHDDKECIVFGSILSPVALSIGYVGYKIAKNGFADLDELAQQENHSK